MGIGDGMRFSRFQPELFALNPGFRMATVSTHSQVQQAPRFFHLTDPVLTTHDFTKSVYLNLLENFPVEDVIEFWKGMPLTWEGHKFSTHALLGHLWQEKAKVPSAWDYSLGEVLEAFLVERNVSIVDFYRKLLYRNNKSTYLPGKFLLKWFYPDMKMVFTADPRDMMMRLIPYFTENFCPHPIHRRIKKTTEGEWTESVMVYISDDRFAETIHFDSEIRAGEQVKACCWTWTRSSRSRRLR